MSLFRSFRLRIALLTAVVAGIVFGVFSIAAYSIIHNELVKNVDSRIMVEARESFGRGIVRYSMARRREWMTRQRGQEGSSERTGRPGGIGAERPERRPSPAPREEQQRELVDTIRPSGSIPSNASNASNPSSPSNSNDAVEEAVEGAQIFASCVAETNESERNELYRSSNWPEGLPVTGSVYGTGTPMEPTEVNDLLRGRRSKHLPIQGEQRGPPREPRRETFLAPNEERTDKTVPDLTAGPSSGGADGAGRPSGDRGRSRGRRGGFVLTKAPHYHYRMADGERWRIGVFSSNRHEVIVAASLTEFTAHVHLLRSAFAIAVPAAVILIALGAWMVSGQAIRPIRHIADTAESVTAAGLSQRIAEPGTGDELQRLTVVLNRMLDRLEDGFKQATRFSADASHELKTPLTIMQGELESALREAPSDSKEQGVYASQLEEITRLKRIVASLLLLSRADAGQLNLTRDRIDVSGNFAAICEDAEILAEGAGVSLEAHVAPNLSIMGDRPLLQQVFQNLISNAVKYNQPDGSIICRLNQDASAENAEFEIENTGPGIPEEDQTKVFRRFHRADAARGRDIDGFGLGLNLALEIARAHNGTLELVRSNADSTIFRLTIPLA